MEEKRKEYGVLEIITCPKCGSDEIDYDDAPEKAKCNSCETEFTLKTVAVWEE